MGAGYWDAHPNPTQSISTAPLIRAQGPNFPAAAAGIPAARNALEEGILFSLPSLDFRGRPFDPDVIQEEAAAL